MRPPACALLLLALTPPVTAPTNDGHIKFTDLGYCWYGGPTSDVPCPWSTYFPNFVRLPAGEVNVTHTNSTMSRTDNNTQTRVTQPPMVMGPKQQLMVQGFEPDEWSDMLVSRDGGTSFGLFEARWPNPQAGGEAAGVGWLKDGTVLAATCEQQHNPGLTLFSRGTANASCAGITCKIGATSAMPLACCGGWRWDPLLATISPLHPGWSTGGCASIRFIEDESDGTIYYITCNSNKQPPHETLERAVVYASTDRGRSFHVRGSLMEWSSESDLLPLGGGRLLAVTRYQTRNCSDSPTEFAKDIGRAIGPHYQVDFHGVPFCVRCILVAVLSPPHHHLFAGHSAAVLWEWRTVVDDARHGDGLCPTDGVHHPARPRNCHCFQSQGLCQHHERIDQGLFATLWAAGDYQLRRSEDIQQRNTGAASWRHVMIRMRMMPIHLKSPLK